MIPYACMTDLPTDLPADDAGESGAAGGQGALTVDEAKELIRNEALQLVKMAMAVYKSLLTPNLKNRNAAAALAAARDIIEMVSEGKLPQTESTKPKAVASVTNLAALSEEIRLAKQAERRGGR